MNPYYRVDNRLVHGQVISTWMPHLRLQRFVLISETVPANQLQMSMFRMAIPQQLGFDAMTVDQGVAWLNGRRYAGQRTLVLMESVGDAYRLFGKGHPFPLLNIGNVHHAANRKHYTNAVYLSDEETTQLKAMMSRGMQCEIRSLPDDPPIDLRKTLVD